MNTCSTTFGEYAGPLYEYMQYYAKLYEYMQYNYVCEIV